MAKDRAPGPRFHTTRWSLIAAAKQASSTEAKAALAALCELYWYPLYTFIRRLGHDADDARDITQAFFVTLLEKKSIRAADRRRGRFRSFLLASCKHFLSKERDRAAALKRGGGRIPFSLDFEAGEQSYLREPAHSMTPERLYERRWAILLLDRLMTRLEDEYARADKGPLFTRLKQTLTGDAENAPHAQTAAELDMTEGAVKVAAHRLRQRFRALLREAIAETVATPEEIDDEIRLLFAAVRTD